MFKLVVLTVLLAAVGTNAFWAPCTDLPGAVAPRTIESAACSGTSCVVTRGQTLLANAFATFPRAIPILTTRIRAFVLGIGITLPQDPPRDNACNSIFIGATQTACPTTPGVETRWEILLDITPAVPALSNTRVRFELMEGTTIVACADVTATLV